MVALARLHGGDEAIWGLAGLGADLDATLTAGNPGGRGPVIEELLLTEGLPPEVAAAARARHEGEPETLLPLARGLVVASTLVDAALALGLDGLTPAHLAGRLSRDERALACQRLLGLDLDATAAVALAGLVDVREDLRL